MFKIKVYKTFIVLLSTLFILLLYCRFSLNNQTQAAGQGGFIYQSEKISYIFRQIPLMLREKIQYSKDKIKIEWLKKEKAIGRKINQKLEQGRVKIGEWLKRIFKNMINSMHDKILKVFYLQD